MDGQERHEQRLKLLAAAQRYTLAEEQLKLAQLSFDTAQTNLDAARSEFERAGQALDSFVPNVDPADSPDIPLVVVAPCNSEAACETGPPEPERLNILMFSGHGTVKERIIGFLERYAPTAHKHQDIAAALNARAETVRFYCGELVKEGRILKPNENLYRATNGAAVPA
jgi:hypothetical protein